MRSKRLVVGAVVALVASLVSVVTLSTTASGAADGGASTSSVCSDWNLSFFDYSNPNQVPGTLNVFDGVAANSTEGPVVFAGDTLTLRVSAPAGTTGRMQIANWDTGKVLASAKTIPNLITVTIPRDSNSDAHSMAITLNITQAGPLTISVGCFGSCRLPGSSTNIRGLLDCQAQQFLGGVSPYHAVHFTPAA